MMFQYFFWCSCLFVFVFKSWSDCPMLKWLSYICSVFWAGPLLRDERSAVENFGRMFDFSVNIGFSNHCTWSSFADLLMRNCFDSALIVFLLSSSLFCCKKKHKTRSYTFKSFRVKNCSNGIESKMWLRPFVTMF